MSNAEVRIPPEAIQALEHGKLIEAIKLTRESEAIGLKEAKEAIERYLAANPSINASFKSKASAGGGGLIVFLIVAAVMAYLFFTGKL